MPAQAGMAAKMNFTDRDVIDFLVNVEWVPHHSLLLHKNYLATMIISACRTALLPDLAPTLARAAPDVCAKIFQGEHFRAVGQPSSCAVQVLGGPF